MLPDLFASPTCRRLILIRHGQSEANRDGLVTGDAETALTDQGRNEALALAPHARPWLEGARLLVSPLNRARQTADLIAPKADWQTLPGLAETDAGPWSLRRQTDFEAAFPDFWPRFSPMQAYPGGESHQDMAIRAIRAIAPVLNETAGTVAAVLHNGPLAAILHGLLGIDMSLFPALQVPTGSMTVIDWTDPHRPRRPSLRLAGWRPDCGLAPC